MRLIPLVLLAGLVATASAQLTSEEKKGVIDALYIGNMTLRDLEFERKPFKDPYRLPIVDLSLDKPLEASDRLMALHAASPTRNIGQLIHLLRTDILGDRPTYSDPNPGQPSAEVGPEIPPNIRERVETLVEAILRANEFLRDSLDKLSPEERRTLIETLPRWANEEPSIKFEFVRLPQASQAQTLALLAKVDLPRIRFAAAQLATKVQEELPKLKELVGASGLTGVVKTTVKGLSVELGGPGSDVHDSRDAVLTIDFGGDDRYTGRYGAGAGYTGLLIDLGGDDTYDVPDLSIGAAILGIGLAYDMGGTDNFRGKSLCFGAGLAGVGAHLKDGGNDTYSSVSLSQGYGQFGIGILLDTKGDDDYRANLNAQGAARTQGVGWLIDKDGRDTYRAGGLILNSPLFKDVYYSNAQGFASGYREDTGGISGGLALLTDLGGDDAYIGETYCQAASYWFSLASLYDVSGHDVYSAYHYAQASAMHMTGAYLFDLAGDDGYNSRMGAAHAIGHDYGVAVFLDRQGNDSYSGRDSRPGIGNANGLGLFIDAAGDDRYFGPPGVANGARGSGSLGIFADLNGTDVYADGLGDGSGTTREAWAVAYDAMISDTRTGVVDAPSQGNAPTPGSERMPAAAQMEEIYRKATQWGVGTAQKEVTDNVNRLIAIGKPALEWMLKTKLKTADRLQVRAFVPVVRALGPEGGKLLAPYVASRDENEARVALSIATEAAAKEVAPSIPEALKKPALQRQAARAAGLLGSKESVPTLMQLAASQDRLLALNAVIALAALGDESAFTTAEALSRSPELPIRKAAIEVLLKFPPRALDLATRLTNDPAERNVRIGIELLGKIGTPEALERIGKLLSDQRSGVKIEAMLALNGRFPLDYRPLIVDLAKDPNPLVQAVATRIDLGR